VALNVDGCISVNVFSIFAKIKLAVVS